MLFNGGDGMFYVWRLNADEQIQMVTALALQLIQCVVKLPSQIDTIQFQSRDEDDVGLTKKKNDFVCVRLPCSCLVCWIL